MKTEGVFLRPSKGKYQDARLQGQGTIELTEDSIKFVATKMPRIIPAILGCLFAAGAFALLMAAVFGLQAVNIIDLTRSPGILAVPGLVLMITGYAFGAATADKLFGKAYHADFPHKEVKVVESTERIMKLVLNDEKKQIITQFNPEDKQIIEAIISACKTKPQLKPINSLFTKHVPDNHENESL